MRITIALASLALAASVVAQPAQRGVFVEDIDKNVDACTDVLRLRQRRLARGQSDSRRRCSAGAGAGQAGEKNKESLKVILDDVSKKHDWPKGSVEQQISDFYGSCMDEERINKLGVEPLKPIFAEIDKIATRAALQDEIIRLHELQVSAPFGVAGTTDNHEPSQFIARVFAAGLGLPDRDYYFKAEARFVEIREKYRQHVAKMFELAGFTKAEAKKAAETAFAFEARLAKAHLDNVALRDPAATDHKVTVAALQEMTPHFDWKRYFDRTGIRPADLNVDQPKFMTAADAELNTTPLAAWKTYLTWTVLNAAAQHLSQPIVSRGLRVLRQLPQRIEGDEAALEALRRDRGRPPRRGARQEVRRTLLSAGREGAHAGDGEEPPRGDGRHDQGPGVDGAGDEGARHSRSSRRSIRKSAIPTSGRTTAVSRSRRRRTFRTSSPA